MQASVKSVQLKIFYNSNVLNLGATLDSFRFLAEANGRGEYAWALYFKYMIASIINLIMLPLASVILCWLTYGNYDANHVYHPLNLVLVEKPDIFKI